MEKEKRKAFGVELRARREAAGFSPEQFAAAIGLKPKTLQQIELGYQNMGKTAMKLAESILTRSSTYEVESRSMAEISEDSLQYNAVNVRDLAAKFVDGELMTKARAVAELLDVSVQRGMEIVLAEKLR